MPILKFDLEVSNGDFRYFLAKMAKLQSGKNIEEDIKINALVDFLVENKEKKIAKMELRDTKIVGKNNFAKFMKKNWSTIIKKCKEKGYLVEQSKCGRSCWFEVKEK